MLTYRVLIYLNISTLRSCSSLSLHLYAWKTLYATVSCNALCALPYEHAYAATMLMDGQLYTAFHAVLIGSLTYAS